MSSPNSRDPQAVLAALNALAKAGDWPKAAKLAIQLEDEEKMVRYSLMAALGRVPPGVERMNPLRAAQYLVSVQRHEQAALLFEYSQDHLSAARSASAARQYGDAARYFERAGEWLEAARSHQTNGRPSDALKALDQGERGLDASGSGRAALQLEELRLVRAELLIEQGNKGAAAGVLKMLAPSVRRAELLERAGLKSEAVQGYLEAGAHKQAHKLAESVPNRELLVAEVHLQSGRPLEAGHIYAQHGMPREAAEAYEKAGQWGYAAYRWEAANQPKRAAEAYENAGQPANAARCYATAGMTTAAVDAYVRGGNVHAAADLHIRAGQLLEAASLYLSKGDKAKAAAILLRIQPGVPSYPMGTLLLAPLLIDEGFAADALERVRRITVRGGEMDADTLNMERNYWEGRALEALGRISEARDCFNIVADLNPGYRDVQQRLVRLHPSQQVAIPDTPATPGPILMVTPPPMRILRDQPEAPDDVLAVGGRVAGRYDILAEVGRGGMGRVFKALDLELGEMVAIKSLVGVSDGGFGEEARLLKELQICRRISHPNVVRVFDLGRVANGLFLTMEFLDGRRLDDLILAESPLPFGRVRGFMSEIAAGLGEAHQLGIVHRDLKPANVIVTPTRLKILDFGIASVTGAQARMTQTGFVMGSPMYMSPDQILGLTLDGRSDLYTLGLLGYCMITGREPYQGIEPIVLLRRKLREPTPDIRLHRPDTPEGWMTVMTKLLAKKPENRYQSARELIDALEELPVEDAEEVSEES